MKSSYVDSLSRLEESARRNAEKRVVEAFQKQDSLENIDVIRTRFLNQKTATEAQLKMAVHGQLDSIQNGLDKLESALGISKACAGRISELEKALGTISSLPSSLSQLHVISTKHKQLVAAIENMSYLVKVPDTLAEARDFIKNENLLEAHKRIQELEGIRDEIMCDVFKQNSSADLNTLRTFFKGLEELNISILDKIKHVGATLTSAVVTQNVLCVNCIRIIDREERADMIWKKRQAKNGFMPDGRPKEWKKKFFAELAKTIQDRVQGCSVDSDNEKTRLVRHNEAIRQHAMRDLRIAKNICPVLFPPDYEIFDRFVEIYHDAIGLHIENLINEGLNDTEIVQLLGWINAYHTEEFMKHQLFNVDFSRLNIQYPPNLLPEDKLTSLRQEYVRKTIIKLNGWLVKSLAIDIEDWKRSTKPELNDASNYYTPLSLMVLSPINELVGEGKLLHFLGKVVRESFLVHCTEEIFSFARNYENSIREYRNAYLSDRARFPYYIEYILANANNTLTIANSFVAVIKKEVETESLLKGRLMQPLNNLKEEYAKVAAYCLNCAEETIFLDLTPVMSAVLTREWLSPGDLTAQCITGTFLDYNDTLVHVNQVYYADLIPRLATHLLIDFLRILLTRTLNFNSVAERHTAGTKLIQTSGILRTFFENKIPVAEKIYKSYDAIGMIGRFLTNDDRKMLTLDIGRLQQDFPDVRAEQIYTILMLRGDIKSQDAQDMSIGVPRDPKTANATSDIFTKVDLAMNR